MIGEFFQDPGSEAVDFAFGTRVGDVHCRTQLTAVGQERRHLGFREAGDVFDVIEFLRLKEEERARTMRCQFLIGEEVWIACSNHAVRHQEAGTAMVRMQAVASPRVMAEDHIGADLANPVRHLPALAKPRVEFAVRPPEEGDVTLATKCAGSGPLLVLSHRDERVEVGVRVPRALAAIGANQVMNVTAARGPLRQCGAAPELDVVRMGTDGERILRRCQIGCRFDRTLPPQTGVETTPRSVGRSTSQLSLEARTMRSGSPRRRLSATCRANEPGP